MKISKFQAANGRCLIKSNTYAHDYEYAMDLIKIALRDFAGLRYRDIAIKVYDDDRWGKQWGLSFLLMSSIQGIWQLISCQKRTIRTYN